VLHSIWNYIKSLPLWALLALILLTSVLRWLGLTPKELVVTILHWVQGWREHRRIEKILNYLSSQFNPTSLVRDGYGHTPLSHYARSSLDIGKATKMSPILALQLLGKLTTQKRVEQQGILDLWRITVWELESRRSHGDRNAQRLLEQVIAGKRAP